MTWRIPAKTFLLGEYAALQGGPALVLTTKPCFEIGLSSESNPTVSDASIHPESPAGRFWANANMPSQLTWCDPYDGIGGLGASSAQFLGAYFAYLLEHKLPFTHEALLEAYWRVSWSEGVGVRPSGYDVLAQAESGCVYLHRNQAEQAVYAWPFNDLDFILLHTGEKLATHHHLQAMRLTAMMEELSETVLLGQQAFEQANSTQLIQAVNTYYQQLDALSLVAEQTQEQRTHVMQDADVLACKGCGALGADVLLLLVPSHRCMGLVERLSLAGRRVLATTGDLYYEKNSSKVGLNA